MNRAAINQSHAGRAIPPPWLTKKNHLTLATLDTWDRIEEMVRDDSFCQGFTSHDITLCRIKHHGQPDQWVTRREYCLIALQTLCDELCLILHIRFRGDWRVIVEGQHGQRSLTGKNESLEQALIEVLAELDPLWK